MQTASEPDRPATATSPPAPASASARASAAAPPRQRLLAAADALFYGEGIRNTGVDAILEHARVARRTLYQQFGGKDGLIVAYLRERDARWTAHWCAAIADADGAEARLLAILDALRTWEPSRQRPRGCAFLDALIEVADPAHPVSVVVLAHWDAIGSRLAELAADVGTADPRGLADDLVLIYRGVLTAMMVEPVDVAVARGRDLAAARVARAVADPAG